jgi:NodT family efflux transporter outer membrane factor (OMF) lipoprotein
LPASAGSSAGTGQDWTRWWSSFGDPALPPLIERALQASPTLAQAEARLRQARAQRDATAAALGPSVSLGASARTSRSEAQATSQAYELGPDASWEPDLWGGSRAGVAAADSNVRASVAGLASVRLALAAEVSLQVLQARGLQARLAIARRNLNSQQQTLNIARWRREAGLVTELDVQQAQASVSQTAAQIPSLVASLRQTEHALAVLTGQPVGSVRLVEGSLPHAPAALSFVMPAEVLRQRPDVVAAEAQLQAAAARVAQAQAQRLPSLTLGGSIGLSALRLSALGAGAGLASLAASARLPLFDGGRLQALVRVQDAAFHEARAAYQATVLGAIQDVEDNLMAIGQTHQQLEHLRTAAAASQAAARLAEQRYASGLIDFSAVLVAQRTQLSADDALATASTSLNTLHVRLFKALGGGWLPGEGPAVQRSEAAP